LGLSVTGTPRVQRRLEADNRRIQELRTIAGIISNSATLPPSLERFGMTDPETKKPYEYLSKTGDRYELCAAFTAAPATHVVRRRQPAFLPSTFRTSSSTGEIPQNRPSSGAFQASQHHPGQEYSVLMLFLATSWRSMANLPRGSTLAGRWGSP
jgi:hypothetical protein